MTFDRRTLLQVLSALAASPLAPPSFGQAPVLSAAQFGALSAKLTGDPPADAGALAKVMRAFATPERRASLVALAKLVTNTPPAELDAAIAAHKLDSVANDLVAAWFSGIVTTPKGQLVLYADALMWRAMTYTKPMGVCGRVTNYWADPPGS
jgi:hypothetical protein